MKFLDGAMFPREKPISSMLRQVTVWKKDDAKGLPVEELKRRRKLVGKCVCELIDEIEGLQHEIDYGFSDHAFDLIGAPEKLLDRRYSQNEAAEAYWNLLSREITTRQKAVHS